MSDLHAGIDGAPLPSLVVKFWAVTIIHEKTVRRDEHEMRVIYGSTSPGDGAAFLMVRHELGKRGAFDYKVPDTAYATGEL